MFINFCAKTLINIHGSERLEAEPQKKKAACTSFYIFSAQLVAVFPPCHKWNPEERKQLVDLGRTAIHCKKRENLIESGQLVKQATKKTRICQYS